LACGGSPQPRRPVCPLSSSFCEGSDVASPCPDHLGAQDSLIAVPAECRRGRDENDGESGQGVHVTRDKCRMCGNESSLKPRPIRLTSSLWNESSLKPRPIRLTSSLLARFFSLIVSAKAFSVDCRLFHNCRAHETDKSLPQLSSLVPP
jgi:hypothetical protein